MSTSLTCWFLREASVSELLMRILRDLSEISRGGGGLKQREGHNFSLGEIGESSDELSESESDS